MSSVMAFVEKLIMMLGQL